MKGHELRGFYRFSVGNYKDISPFDISQSALFVHIPRRILSSWQRRKSQILTVPSSEHVANLLSVGEKLLHEDTQQGKEVSI